MLDVDGVLNQADSCASTPAGANVNSVGCPDTDADGVFDNNDTCAATPASTPVDSAGCDIVQPKVEVAYSNDMMMST